MAGVAVAQTAPVKIAGSLDLSGPAASVGKDALVGVQHAVEVLNEKGGVLGRPVAFDYQDNGTNAQRASSQAMALVKDGGAVMLISPQSSGNTLAVSKTVSAKLKMPMCVSASSSDDITMKDFQPYVFSVTTTSYQTMRADAIRMAKQPYKRYAVLGGDSAAGRANVARFKEFIKELNPQAEIVIEEYPKLGAIDYTASINKILAAKPDYVLAILYGTDLITFSKQASALGFFKQVDNRFYADYDETTLKALGEFAAVGTDGGQRAPAGYLANFGSQSKDYVTRFKAKYGTLPSDWTTLAYDCVMIWAQAANAAKTTDADAVMRAIESNEFASMRGPLRFAKYDHQADTPVFMGRLEYSKDLGQAVMAITEVMPGSVVRPSEAVVLKSRRGE
jgi:branched-chain amino acid transport system substrate-binding protein